MRERFVLCSRVIGLCLVCGGVLLAAGQLPRFFMEPDWSELYPDISGTSSLWNEMAPQLRKHVTKSGHYFWRFALSDMIVQGILPVLLGLYLMRSNNVFVRNCYGDSSDAPFPAEHSPAHEADTEPQELVSKPKDDDSKWKPPEHRG
jgi:hypothetical protein